jgi:NAD(P)-dependent dehydrogenase (short-subunit alcohol dehydrogenase family)
VTIVRQAHGQLCRYRRLADPVTVDVGRRRALTPLGRLPTVDQIAGPALFMFSPAVSFIMVSFITATDLLVDGGLVLHVVSFCAGNGRGETGRRRDP